MSIEEKNIAKMRRLLALMDEDSLSRADFTKAFSQVIKFVKEIERKNEYSLGSTINDLTNDAEMLRNTSKRDFGELRDRLTTLAQIRLEEVKDMLEIKSGEIDEKLETYEESILTKARADMLSMEFIIENLPPEAIRDSLEKLEDDERLDASAIKNLEMFIKEKIEKHDKMKFVGGTPRPRFIDDETLAGTKNGVNKAFTINLNPSPVASLKVYRNGQRMRITEDYTFSGKTITFITAPESDEVLYADYRA